MDDGSAKKPNFFERVLSRLSNDTPENVDEILEVLRAAADNEAVDSDTLQLLENVLDFGDMEVRDVMVTRSQMDVIKASDSIERIIAYIQETAHSRFPVIGEDKDEILGILHAKDLLRYFGQPEQFQLKQVLRPAMFVPESKALNNVIKDFRTERNHMAIVIDEYGGVSGLITLEDVSEQIMGDIEDEFDLDDSEDQIFAINPERFRVNATTEIEDFNEYFKTDYSDEEADTIGGLVIHEFGRLPQRGEKVAIDKWLFTIARADARRLHVLLVTPNPS